LPRGQALSGRSVAGVWSHVAPPEAVPSWIGCDGFQGVFAYARADAGDDATHLLVRAVAFPESGVAGFAVVVGLDMNGVTIQQVRHDTGVQLGRVAALSGDVPRLTGKRAVDTPAVSDGRPLPLGSITFLEYRDWESGRSGTLVIATRLSAGELYD